MIYCAVCGIIAFLTGLPCAVFVFFNKPRTPLKILWSLYSLGISVWGLGIFYLFTTSHYEVAIVWGRVLNLNAIFIPVFFFHVVVLLTNTYEQHKKAVIAYYLILGFYFFAAIIFPQYFVRDVLPKLGFRFYPDAGPIYYFLPYFFFHAFIHGFTILFKAYQKASAIRRNQYKYFFISSIFGILGGLTSLFPVFNFPVFPFGVILVPVYNLVVVYIIIKHHLLDIRIVIRKGLIYTILAGFITLFYLIAIYLIGTAFHDVLGNQSAVGSMTAVILIAIMFIPLKDYAQSLVDKYFFKASYLQMVEQNDMLKQQAVRAERYQMMSALSQKIINELRNPLTALVGYRYQLPKRLNDQEFLNKFVMVFNKELLKLQDLIQQLSDFSELKPLNLEPVNMTVIINELLEHLSEHLQGKNIMLYKYYQDGQEFMIHADMEQIKRAVYVFLANSVKSTSLRGQIWVGMEDSQEGLEISIKDTGAGLSQEDLFKIFDPFFSVSKGTESTNMSLAQAQNIVSHHGGKVMVDSQLNIGTEWIIQLPKFSKI